MPRALALPAAAALLQLNRLALRTGLRAPIDGWRRAAALVLRHERSTFILSAFNLRAPTSESDFAARLHAFLKAEPLTHVRVQRAADEDRLIPTAPAYTLAFQPWLDGPDRFAAPTQWLGREAESRAAVDASQPAFNIVARRSPEAGGRADLWLRINHVALDGVPVQELLNRLEQSWGIAAPPIYPAPEDFTPRYTPIGPAQDNVSQLQFFADFTPLLAWRKAHNAKLPEPMTVSAAILHRLAQLPNFKHLHLGTTVEVEATTPRPNTTLPRGVSVVVTKPAAFTDLAAYARDFNAQLAATRTRQSTSCKTLDAAAHLPAPLAHALLEHALTNVPKAFGTLALTMLKDAKVFGAPLAAHGHPNGFIAIGSLSLPTRDNRQVGCITIKGAPSVIADYPKLITEALQ